MDDDLLPCPFCGGMATLDGAWRSLWAVRCIECNAQVGTVAHSSEYATMLWNRRDPKSMQEVLQRQMAEHKDPLAPVRDMAHPFTNQMFRQTNTRGSGK